MRSFIQAAFTLETERGMSMMLVESPMTSPMGRTVGSTCSVIGTSLTVNFSRVVTCSFSVLDAVPPAETVVEVVVVVVAGGGVEDWACNPALNAKAKQQSAGHFTARFWVLRYMMSLVFR
jgi:hypothetical protein